MQGRNVRQPLSSVQWRIQCWARYERPFSVQFLSFSYSFWQKICQIIGWHPLGLVPLLWIRQCQSGNRNKRGKHELRLKILKIKDLQQVHYLLQLYRNSSLKQCNFSIILKWAVKHIYHVPNMQKWTNHFWSPHGNTLSHLDTVELDAKKRQTTVYLAHERLRRYK